MAEAPATFVLGVLGCSNDVLPSIHQIKIGFVFRRIFIMNHEWKVFSLIIITQHTGCNMPCHFKFT
jgi:hypothetical protein